MTCPPFHTNGRKESREAIRINAAKARRRVISGSRFQKKSKSGIKTPTEDMELIRRRLKTGKADDKAQLEKGKAS